MAVGAELEELEEGWAGHLGEDVGHNQKVVMIELTVLYHHYAQQQNAHQHVR